MLTDGRGADPPSPPMPGRVHALAASSSHAFSKAPAESITVIEGCGVAGDAHAGATVKHRSRVARDPTQPNPRQVHLIHRELLAELLERGFEIAPGEIGENVCTENVDLLALPRGATLWLGEEAEVEITGLRNPCRQLDDFRPGLMAALLGRAGDGSLVRKAGVMAVVRRGGVVRLGDPIQVVLPPLPHRRLEPV